MKQNSSAAVLKRLNACTPAQDWARKQKQSLEVLWNRCPRADWLLWVLGATVQGFKPGNKVHKRFVRVACEIARTTLHLVPPGENRPRIVIETTERWTRGRATLKQVEVASGACWEYYGECSHATRPSPATRGAEAAAAAGSTGHSAHSAGYSAHSAGHSAAVVLRAAATSSATATAAGAAATTPAVAATRVATTSIADIVRKHFSFQDVKGALQGAEVQS